MTVLRLYKNIPLRNKSKKSLIARSHKLFLSNIRCKQTRRKLNAIKFYECLVFACYRLV